MFDNVTIHVRDIVTWLPIFISGVALYYSRKAWRFQERLERRKQVALINLHIIEDGIELSNPDRSAMLRAEVHHHHRWFGTHSGNVDCRKHGPEFETEFFAIDRLREKKARQWREWASWRSPSVGDGWMQWLLAFMYRPRRPRRRRPAKAKRGQHAIAEVFLTDAAWEQWYVNTDGVKRHVPRRPIPRALFRVAWRLRLIGYPPGSGFSFPHWYNLVLVAVNATLILDHYFNGGKLLMRVLLALGAKQL